MEVRTESSMTCYNNRAFSRPTDDFYPPKRPGSSNQISNSALPDSRFVEILGLWETPITRNGITN